MTIEAGALRPAGSGVTVRAVRSGDEALILAEMLAALERGEYDAMEPHQVVAAADGMVHDDEVWAVAEVDGQLAGWIGIADNFLAVVPSFRRRGVGRRLVEAGRELARTSGEDRLRLWVPQRPGPEAFATACGLAYASSLWQMRLDGDPLAAIQRPEFPAGTTARPLRPGIDEGPFVELVNRIFLDHPSRLHLTEEQVRGRHAVADFDPATVLVVEDAAGAMVAFCRVQRFDAGDGTPSGEIRLLGVDRPWRGRGLGRAVTVWGIDALRRRGAQSVVLAVEGRNEGALRLYANLGFRFRTEWRHWTIAVSSATISPSPAPPVP